MTAYKERRALAILARLRSDRLRRSQAAHASAQAAMRRAEAEAEAARAAVAAMRLARKTVHERLHSDLAAAPSQGAARFDILRVALNDSKADVAVAERHAADAAKGVERAVAAAAETRRHMELRLSAQTTAAELLDAADAAQRRDNRRRREGSDGDTTCAGPKHKWAQ